MGLSVGAEEVGDDVGLAEGAGVGILLIVGPNVGFRVGETVGLSVGEAVGSANAIGSGIGKSKRGYIQISRSKTKNIKRDKSFMTNSQLLTFRWIVSWRCSWFLRWVLGRCHCNGVGG